MSHDHPTAPPPPDVFPLLAGPLDSPPPSAVLGATFGAQSRRNPVSSTNDEHYLVMRLGRNQETLLTSIPDQILNRFEESAYGMVLADGLGTAGEMASRLAISTLVELAICFGRWNLRVSETLADEVGDRAARFYRNVDSVLLHASRHRRNPLQTSLTAVFVTDSQLLLAHVGASRAYVFRDDQLLQLTHDHTGDHSGDPTDDRRPGHPAQTQTLGGSAHGTSRVDVERCALLDGDAVLLCTTGLTAVADDATIAATLRRHATPHEQCGALVDLAVRLGTTQDVTAVMGHYRLNPLAERDQTRAAARA